MCGTRTGLAVLRGCVVVGALCGIAVPVAAQEVGVLSGRVSGPGGNPVANATVSVADGLYGAVTDRAGQYRISEFPAGSHQVITRYVGLKADTQTVVVPPGGLVRVDVAMQISAIALEGITVEGERGGQLRAINEKRLAATVTDVISADEIGALPDQNVAEAVQRVSGVAIRTSRGEGRFVSIRGTAPNLNSVTLNGQTLASTAESRATALDLLPAAMVSSIEVVKAITPDMDGNGVGGTINLKTLTAFDRNGPFIFGSVEGLRHQQQVDYLDAKPPFEADLTAGRRFGSNESWGLVVAASASRRDFTASVLDPDGYEEVDGNLLPNELELQVEDNERERYGVSSNLDWRPRPGTELYLRGLYTRTREVDANSEFEITFEGDLEMQTPTVGRYTAGSVELDLSGGEERESLYAVTLGGRQRIGQNVAWDNAATWTRGVLNNAGPDVTFETPASEEDRASTVFDVEPYFFTVEPEDPAYIADPLNYPLRSASWSRQSNVENSWAASSDLRIDIGLGSLPAYLKVGGKLQRRDKVIDDRSDRYIPHGITLAPFALPATGTVQGGSEAFLHGDVKAFAEFFASNRDDPQVFELDEAATAYESVDNDSDNDERIYAGYAMGNVDIGRLSLLGGLRVERTTTRSRRYEVFEDESEDGIEVVDRALENAYTSLLPAAVLKFQATDDLVLRAAWTNTIGRPDYEELAGFRRVRYRPTAVPDVYEGTITEGNPDLKPYEASNLDVSIEYYFPLGGMLSAGAFYKRIANPIYDFQVTERDIVVDGIRFAELDITQDRNADDGTVRGIELSYSQPLIFLPWPFDGLGITANAALIDSEVQVPGREDPVNFFGQSRRIYNLVPYFQRGPVELRVAWTHRGAYLDGIGAEAVLDRYGDDRATVDLSGRYRLPSGRLELFAQARNLTNEPEVGYQGTRSRYDVHTLTGRTFTLGLSLNY